MNVDRLELMSRIGALAADAIVLAEALRVLHKDAPDEAVEFGWEAIAALMEAIGEPVEDMGEPSAVAEAESEVIEAAREWLDAPRGDDADEHDALVAAIMHLENVENAQ